MVHTDQPILMRLLVEPTLSLERVQTIVNVGLFCLGPTRHGVSLPSTLGTMRWPLSGFYCPSSKIKAMQIVAKSLVPSALRVLKRTWTCGPEAETAFSGRAVEL